MQPHMHKHTPKSHMHTQHTCTSRHTTTLTHAHTICTYRLDNHAPNHMHAHQCKHTQAHTRVCTHPMPKSKKKLDRYERIRVYKRNVKAAGVFLPFLVTEIFIQKLNNLFILQKNSKDFQRKMKQASHQNIYCLGGYHGSILLK